MLEDWKVKRSASQKCCTTLRVCQYVATPTTADNTTLGFKL